jgi:iron complex transport system substrate-binding protein
MSSPARPESEYLTARFSDFIARMKNHPPARGAVAATCFWLRRFRPAAVLRVNPAGRGALAAAGLLMAAGAFAEGAFPMEITDGFGRRVVIARRPGRIVSLAPSLTETVFTVGNGARLAGVTRFCNFPAGAEALPKVGGFAARTISIEAIVALRPDIVLAGDEGQRPVVEALERLGIPVAAARVTDFETLFASIRLQGRLAGCEGETDALVAGLRARVEAVAQRAAEIPEGRRARVYWEAFDEPLMSAGPRSLIGRQIALAGGVNIFGEAREPYPQVSGEAVVARNPQVILGSRILPGRPALTAGRLARRPGWAGIDAVREGRVFTLPDELVTRAGPRLVEGLELMARTIYPEWFGAETEAKR